MSSFRLQSLVVATLAVTGCSSNALLKGDLEQQSQYSGTTLADLENTDIGIDQDNLEAASADETLQSYRQAADLFDDPNRRSETLRRMADLALSSAEQQELEGGDDEDARLEEEVDQIVYEQTMATAQTTANTERKMALMGLAGTMAPSVEAKGNVDYDTAIALYTELLNNTDDPAQRAEAYYLLSKAYDMDGQLDKARENLNALVTQYPDSQWALEGQFRRGEMLFSEGDMESAEQAYADVIARGSDNEFYHQALYKRGWSHYKLGDYRPGLNSFFTLLDTLQGNPALDDDTSMENKLHADTLRVVGLSFSNLEGPQSVRRWFAKEGQRDYEPSVYDNLGQVYLAQERFRDAANAFAMFATVYPESSLAPVFSSREIQAYQKGGFPTLVLPAKKQFIEHYGVSSNYWQHHPKGREGYVSQLKGHILDLAQYHHALAQQGDDPDAFMVSARWYREYLQTPPAGERKGEINHRYGDALFLAQRYPAAIKAFEQTAYDYDDYPHAADAAYAAQVAYQQQLQQGLDESAQQQWRENKIASGLKYHRYFPEHEHALAVLRHTAEDQLAVGDTEGAVKTAGLLINHEPPPSPDLLRYGWATIANGELDLGRFAVAEMAYKKLLTLDSLTDEGRSNYRDKLALSIYRQAEQQRDEGDLDQAAASFLRVGKTVPAASIRKNAEYDAANLLIKQDRSADAIVVLKAFRERYPDDPLSDTVADKLAVAYEKTGNYTGAAEELTRIAQQHHTDNPELARQAFWRAAQMQDRAEKPDASIALYKQYLEKWPEPYEFRSEAQFRLVELARKTGRSERETYWLQALQESYRQAGAGASDRVAWLAAYASFTLAEPQFQRFQTIKLDQPLKSSLAEKTAVMKKALNHYQAVADIGVADFATAANFKIGELYRLLARDLIASERPEGLDELELEEYSMLLEDKAFPYEDKAIDILITNSELVTDDIYDQWVKKSFAALAELIPGRYAKFEQVESHVDIIY